MIYYMKLHVSMGGDGMEFRSGEEYALHNFFFSCLERIMSKTK